MNQEGLSRVTMRMAVIWGVLFSINSLGTCVMVALSNASWVTMPLQAKFLMVVGIGVNWTGLLMAFVSKTVARLEVGKPPPTNGTDFLTKVQAEQQTPKP